MKNDGLLLWPKAKNKNKYFSLLFSSLFFSFLTTKYALVDVLSLTHKHIYTHTPTHTHTHPHTHTNVLILQHLFLTIVSQALITSEQENECLFLCHLLLFSLPHNHSKKEFGFSLSWVNFLKNCFFLRFFSFSCSVWSGGFHFVTTAAFDIRFFDTYPCSHTKTNPSTWIPMHARASLVVQF